MVWDTCNVILHGSSNGIFYTNNVVTGSINLNIKQECKIQHIDIKVIGTSKAMWSRPSPTMPYIKIYSEKEDIFYVLIDVFRDLKCTTLQPGLISRQFHFILPPDLPSSYKDSVAKVYYKIVIKSKGSYKLPKKKDIPFTVVSHVNLDELDEYKLPMIFELTKNFGKSGNFLMNFKTYRGFAVNQLIPFEAIITNENKIRVRKIKVTLVQKIDYNITSGFYTVEKNICKSNFTDVLNKTEQSCFFHMEIPEITPSTINVTDPMVNITYFLNIKVKFRFHFPLYSDIPVTICTVPLNHKRF